MSDTFYDFFFVRKFKLYLLYFFFTKPKIIIDQKSHFYFNVCDWPSCKYSWLWLVPSMNVCFFRWVQFTCWRTWRCYIRMTSYTAEFLFTIYSCSSEFYITNGTRTFVTMVTHHCWPHHNSNHPCWFKYISTSLEQRDVVMATSTRLCVENLHDDHVSNEVLIDGKD